MWRSPKTLCDISVTSKRFAYAERVNEERCIKRTLLESSLNDKRNQGRPRKTWHSRVGNQIVGPSQKSDKQNIIYGRRPGVV